MSKEQLFYQTLKDIFIGAKIEGKSGYINLMRIKSKYYEKIKTLLEKDIYLATLGNPSFKEELFDKLYTFFKRYFSENGSIYFHDTPFHNNIYEKIYTPNKDVILFWKTKMLYYVKSERIFRSIPIEFDNIKFYFDASQIEHKKSNEKKSLIYELKEIDFENTIHFTVLYSEKSRVTKTDDILKTLKKAKILITEEQLENAFKIFEKQSEVDFFIHKNAKAFLQEQFKLWSYQYFWEGAKEWTAERVNQLQILKNIAFKIIDFVSQFEDELVKIWNKPKFVKNANYVITLDRMTNKPQGKQLIQTLLNHEGMQNQIKEWQELGIVDEHFDKNHIIQNGVLYESINPKYQFLPIDTKYFKDVEYQILSLFEDLDNELNGWLIKSENYQALNTVLPKFNEKVQTIYIDPPFNLESSDQFLYRTNYKDASWATLLENRLNLAKNWLNEKGSIFVRCDYNGNWIVRCVMDEIFGKENFRNEILVSRVSKQDPKVKKFNAAVDTVLFFGKSENSKFFMLFKKLPNSKQERWHAMDSQGQGQALYIFGYLVSPPKGRHWTYGQESINQMEIEGKIRLKCKNCGYVHTQGKWEGCPECNTENEIRVEYLLPPTEVIQIHSNWTDISGYTSTWGFQTENSESLLFRVVNSTSNSQDFVLDFFLGSGTTTAVAHKLGRKWIGIEMGEHFYTVVLPRMKKVLAYDKSGISKEKEVKENYNETKAGGFFKYYELEQYEEALANTVYENHDLFIIGDKEPYEQYVFMKDEKMLRAIEIDYENDKVKVNLSKLYENIDIAETLSNLTGKWIKKIEQDKVYFEGGTVIDIQNLDYKLIKPLIWWE